MNDLLVEKCLTVTTEAAPMVKLFLGDNIFRGHIRFYSESPGVYHTMFTIMFESDKSWDIFEDTWRSRWPKLC